MCVWKGWRRDSVGVGWGEGGYLMNRTLRGVTCSDGMELQCFQMPQSWQSWYLNYPEVLQPHKEKMNTDGECENKKNKTKGGAMRGMMAKQKPKSIFSGLH